MKRLHTLLYISIALFQFACQISKKPTPPVKVTQQSVPKQATDNFALPQTSTPAVVTQPVEEVKYEPVAMTVGTHELKTSDLALDVEKRMIDDSISPKSALEEVIYDQRIIADAKKRGYHESEEFKGEMETYRGILAEAYLTDSTTIKYLLRETYDWMKQEIRASHIMYQISEFAEPADTAAIYQKLIDIRNKAIAGDDFGVLAQQFSQDKKTSSTGGDLGWFKALQFVYPIEKAAYTTPVGQVSMPFKSKGGYHIVKVNERRPFSGNVRVQHILKMVALNAPDSVNVKIKAKIDSIYNQLNKGVAFEELCKKYSDDYKTKNYGGFLPAFGIGTREETAFEQAAFALQEGAISQPVRTSAGWHIIKLAQKLPLESFEVVYPKIKEKIVTDSRGEVVKENALRRLKKEMQFVENEDVIKKAVAAADTNLLRKKWNYAFNDETTNQTIFSIGKKQYKTKLFYDFAVDRQTFERIPAGFTPSMVMRSFYKKFVDNTVKTYAEEHLEDINPEFKLLLNEYSTSLLKMQLLNDLVYEKSTSDTTGQRIFYEKNIEKYRMPERVLATVIASKDAKTVYQVKDIFVKGTPYNLKRAYNSPLYYAKNLSDLLTDHKKVLTRVLEVMRRNKGYVLEIGGHADQSEGDNASAERIEKVKTFLLANGLTIERIIENDYAKTNPNTANKFDWSKNQRVTFRFYSTSKKDVEKIFNTKEPNSVIIEEGYFKKGENKFADIAKWEVGTQSVVKDGRFADVIIEKVEPARYKSLREARGQVLSDYQKSLEKKFNDDLISKYPIKLNNEEIQKALNTKKQ
jgi:peptidyl-prolyl cis-trans isomerase SurA